VNKILIFYGSNRAFLEECPTSFRNLTDVVAEVDDNSKNMILHIPAVEKETQEVEKKPKIKIENFVINSDEYSGVREHVIINFANFIANMDIENMYIQNPPLQISEQLHRLYDLQNIIKVVRQPYSKITKAVIQKFNKEYDDKIIGQEKAKGEVLQSLYPLMNDKQKKPAVVLFYGDTGIGKTETANYLSELLNGKLMRKQFSMYQNNNFATYLFGGTNNEGSFAKDLLDRDSNVILLDEFDKANPVFHSAFYQLFDEGVYEDKNYKVNLDYAIIICTSNYKTKGEIIEHLGSAIYNRFDAVIHFQNLSVDAKTKITEMTINEISASFKEDDIEIEQSILEKLKKQAIACTNVREIKRLIKGTFSLYAIRKLCSSEQE
jgi:DNA-binding NtrC family response regulator